MLDETSIRKVVIRLRTSLCVVLRVASKLQCSVASSCARTAGGTPPGSGLIASGGTALLSFRSACRQAGTLPEPSA